MVEEKEEAKPAYPYKLGYALSGGAAKGFAHLGVLKYLEEIGVKPDIIAGTSAGALMGSLYADGYSPDEILNLFDGKYFKLMTEFQIPQVGVFGTKGFQSFLDSIYQHKRIEELPIPMRVVTTNLDEGKSVVFDQGPMVEIVSASCSIPVLFNPVKIGAALYVDGGLFKNFPVSVIRNECQRVIGVHLNPEAPAEYKKNIIGIAERSFNYIFRANAELDRKLCDLLLESAAITQFGRFEVDAAATIMQLGYDMAIESVKDCDWIYHYAKKSLV